MKTTSGAHVFVIDGRAIKLGRGAVRKRLLAQADYCGELGRVCPIVECKLPWGYVMERLDRYPRHVTVDRYVRDALYGLETVWCRPTIRGTQHMRMDVERHLGYVISRTNDYAPHLLPRAWRLASFVDLARSRPCLVHGDPTVDNMMMRDGEPVIIDPLPPQMYMPEYRAVDIGKLLQSILGYEEIKYGSTRGLKYSRSENLTGTLWKNLNVPHSEMAASAWFCFAHCVRLLPYQTKNHLEYLKLAARALRMAEEMCV